MLVYFQSSQIPKFSIHHQINYNFFQIYICFVIHIFSIIIQSIVH